MQDRYGSAPPFGRKGGAFLDPQIWPEALLAVALHCTAAAALASKELGAASLLMVDQPAQRLPRVARWSPARVPRETGPREDRECRAAEISVKAVSAAKIREPFFSPGGRRGFYRFSADERRLDRLGIELI